MNIQWVLADNLVLEPSADINRMKNVGSFWGSWKTWRAYQTDNVVCYDRQKAEELIKKAFHGACNLYLPNSIYSEIGKPPGVRLYEGGFMGHTVDCQEEIIAMNLAGSISDVVLLIGFDWRKKTKSKDELQEIRNQNYNGLVLQAIKQNPDTQWVLVDHPGKLQKDLSKLDNLGQDTLQGVLKLLNA